MLFLTDSTCTHTLSTFLLVLVLNYAAFEATPTIKAVQPCVLIGHSWHVTFHVHIPSILSYSLPFSIIILLVHVCVCFYY